MKTVWVKGYSAVKTAKIACFYGINKNDPRDKKTSVRGRKVNEKFEISADPPSDEEKAQRQETVKTTVSKRWPKGSIEAYLKYNDFMPDGMILAEAPAEAEDNEDDPADTTDLPEALDEVSLKEALVLIAKVEDEEVLAKWQVAEQDGPKRKGILEALKKKIK